MATNKENPTLRQQLQAGIAAAKAGDKANARQLLEGVIAIDDRNELAWIWLASVVPTVRERRVCLEKVLQINPANERARQALNQLVSAVSPQTPTQRPTEPMRATELQATAKQPQGRNNNVLIALGGLVVALVLIAVVSAIFNPQVSQGGLPITYTPLPAQAVAAVRSPTPVLTATRVFILVTPNPATLPPTFTPTATFTPEPSFTPSPTPFPLGQYTLFYTTRGNTEAVPSLYQTLGDGSGQQPLLENVRDVVFDPTGDQVAFVRDVSATITTASAEEATAEPISTQQLAGEIFVAPVNDLAQARQLTNIQIASAYGLAFSPDGKQIAFYSDYTGNDEIFVIEVATGTTQQLTNDPGIDRDPTWLADGSGLIFASDRQSPSNTDLYRLTFVPNGTPTVSLFADNLGNSYAPNVSLNGQWVTYVNDAAGSGDIYVIDIKGQRQSQIVAGNSEEDNPVWSPDGRFVAFTSNREEDLFQIYLVEPPDRTVVRVNRDGRETLNAQFRPDLIFRVLGK